MATQAQVSAASPASNELKRHLPDIQRATKRVAVDINHHTITAADGLLMLDNMKNHKSIMRCNAVVQRKFILSTEQRVKGKSPEEYLLDIVGSRNLSSRFQKKSSEERGFYKKPTEVEIRDYDLALREATRKSLTKELEEFAKSGRTFSACNKFGEGLTHIACRSGSAEALQLILQHGGSLQRSDDLGRIPLHDACWASEPSWDIIRMNIDADDTLLLTTDKRGWTPLRYVNRANWAKWRDFFDEIKDIYWPEKL